ncbi:MAG TPA: TAXI family TRAP transporter solute-binding subunit [Syntrophales bacterium]|nr:TAXI family TRAP transporter solute-binding subunit [Syntrophales bacterium]HOL59125.1 TAXI family TRAP transporter solute-binding subunit [Syntrophales bacterium]HPO36070.1 TAXI family TRAP transporter solute-binding subunit [Syntrophales bacterium]
MKKQKKVWVGITVFFFLLAFTVAISAATTRLAIGTASTGGTWYPLGGAIASVISKYVKGTEATAYPSGASVENIRLLRKGQTDLVMLMPDSAYWAYTGTEQFAKDKPYQSIRAILAMYPIYDQIVVLDSSNIHSISDMKGKRIAVGNVGSGTEIMNRLILAEYGITYNDCTPKFLSAPEAVEALKDGNIDVIMYALGAPAPAIMDLLTVRKCRFIEIEPHMMKQINKKYPFYIPMPIKAGTYQGQTKPVKMLAWMGILAVDAKMPDELVYQILKAFWDHKDEIDKVHVQFKDITLQNAPNVPIPLHNGAVKFYRERGVLK